MRPWRWRWPPLSVVGRSFRFSSFLSEYFDHPLIHHRLARRQLEPPWVDRAPAYAQADDLDALAAGRDRDEVRGDRLAHHHHVGDAGGQVVVDQFGARGQAPGLLHRHRTSSRMAASTSARSRWATTQVLRALSSAGVRPESLRVARAWSTAAASSRVIGSTVSSGFFRAALRSSQLFAIQNCLSFGILGCHKFQSKRPVRFGQPDFTPRPPIRAKVPKSNQAKAERLGAITMAIKICHWSPQPRQVRRTTWVE